MQHRTEEINYSYLPDLPRISPPFASIRAHIRPLARPLAPPRLTTWIRAYYVLGEWSSHNPSDELVSRMLKWCYHWNWKPWCISSCILEGDDLSPCTAFSEAAMQSRLGWFPSPKGRYRYMLVAHTAPALSVLRVG